MFRAAVAKAAPQKQQPRSFAAFLPTPGARITAPTPTPAAATTAAAPAAAAAAVPVPDVGTVGGGGGGNTGSPTPSDELQAQIAALMADNEAKFKSILAENQSLKDELKAIKEAAVYVTFRVDFLHFCN